MGRASQLPQRIVIFAAGNERGGAATHLRTLAKTIVRHEETHRFVVCLLGDGPLATALQGVYPRVTVLNGGVSVVVRHLRRVLCEYPAQTLLHAHGPRLNLIASLAVRKTRIPWVSTIHSNIYQDFLSSRWKSLMYPRLTLWALNSAAGLFLINPKFAELFPGKWTTFVPNAVELSPLDQPKATYRVLLRQKLGIQEDVPVAGVAARLDPVKDVATTVRALVHLAEKRVHLAIAGDGPERPALASLAQQLGVADRVHFLGFIDDIPAFYAGLDVHVLSSRSEGTPSSLLEAGFYGVPNVGTDIPGITHVLTDGVTGRCFPVGDDLALATVIDELLSQPEEASRFVARFQSDVLPKFTPDAMWSAYVDGYRRIWSALHH